MLHAASGRAPSLALAPIPALLACWRARARERRVLAAFDARHLADIDLTRLDVSRECAKPFWRA